VLVPFSLCSLAIGVLQSLTTRLGLLLHYWVVAKVLVNVVAVAVLLLYAVLDQLDLGSNETTESGTVNVLRDPSAVTHAAVAAILLVVTTVLSVYKPRGLTRRGLRRQVNSAREPTEPVTG